MLTDDDKIMFKVGDLVKRIDGEIIGIVAKIHYGVINSTDIYEFFPKTGFFYTNLFFPARYFKLIK